jgi:transposase
MDEVSVPQPIGRPRCRPLRLAGDKGYSHSRVREWLGRRRIEAVIPQRKDQRERHRGRSLKFDCEAYRRRNVVERCVNWLKECRRLATRFAKLAVNYLAVVELAMIQRYLRITKSAY